VFNVRSTEKTIKSSRQDQLENTIKSSRQDQMKKTIQNQLGNSIESSISSIERQLKVQNYCFLLERENWEYVTSDLTTTDTIKNQLCSIHLDHNCCRIGV